MNAEIIAIGSELILGQILNTNAQYLSKALSNLGINVYYHTAVGDNKYRILDVLSISSKRSDIVILTGGLGPTLDDLTKETLAEFLKTEMILHEKSLEIIQDYMKRRGRTMSAGAIKQAMILKESNVLPNEHGTAPGQMIKKRDKLYILLPGPPFELKPMFEKYCLPELSLFSNDRIVSRVLKIYGIGESIVEEKIRDLLVNQSNPTIAPLAGYGDVSLRLTAKCFRSEEPEDKFKAIESEIRKRLGTFIYGTDNDTLESVVALLLAKHRLTLSIAESCTGGLISNLLTDLPGISSVFTDSVIAYHNTSKLKRLNVNQETISKYGSVSEQVAIEMARGIKSTSGTDIGLSVTGIAGPAGGTDEKPVGLIYTAVSINDDFMVEKHLLIGDRKRIKVTAANIALNLLRLALLKLQ